MSGNEEIRKFVETYKITFPVGKEQGLARRLGVRGMPTTVFVAKDGTIVKRQFGAVTREQLVSTIDAMLK